MELQKHGQGNQYSDLLDREIEIAKRLYNLNLIVTYPLSDRYLADWAIMLNKEIPDLDLTLLSEVIRRYSIDEFEWNRSKGIQNIFSGIRELQRLKPREDEKGLSEDQIRSKRDWEDRFKD